MGFLKKLTSKIQSQFSPSHASQLNSSSVKLPHVSSSNMNSANMTNVHLNNQANELNSWLSFSSVSVVSRSLHMETSDKF